jgi:hypothetical protein
VNGSTGTRISVGNAQEVLIPAIMSAIKARTEKGTDESVKLTRAEQVNESISQLNQGLMLRIRNSPWRPTIHCRAHWMITRVFTHAI